MLCGLYALAMSLRAARNLVETIPDDLSAVQGGHYTFQDLGALKNSDEFVKEVFRFEANTDLIRSNPTRELLMGQVAKYFDANNFDIAVLEILLSMVNKRLGTFYKLGRISKGSSLKRTRMVVHRRRHNQRYTENDRTLIETARATLRSENDDSAQSLDSVAGVRRLDIPWRILVVRDRPRTVGSNGNATTRITTEEVIMSPSAALIQDAEIERSNRPVVWIHNDGRGHWEGFAPSTGDPSEGVDNAGNNWDLLAETTRFVNRGMFLVQTDLFDSNRRIAAFRGSFLYNTEQNDRDDDDALPQYALARSQDSEPHVIRADPGRLFNIQTGGPHPVPVQIQLNSQDVARRQTLGQPTAAETIVDQANTQALIDRGGRLTIYRANADSVAGELRYRNGSMVRRIDNVQLHPTTAWHRYCNQDQVGHWVDISSRRLDVLNDPWAIEVAAQSYWDYRSRDWRTTSRRNIWEELTRRGIRLDGHYHTVNQLKRVLKDNFQGTVSSHDKIRMCRTVHLPGGNLNGLTDGEQVKFIRFIGSRLALVADLDGTTTAMKMENLEDLNMNPAVSSYSNWDLWVPVHDFQNDPFRQGGQRDVHPPVQGDNSHPPRQNNNRIHSGNLVLWRNKPKRVLNVPGH